MAVVVLAGRAPLRVFDPFAQPPVSFKNADGWVSGHLDAGQAGFFGSMTSPAGQTMLVWLVLPPGADLTAGGHTWAAAAGSLIGVTISSHDRSYVGPVYFRSRGGSWTLLTAHPSH